MLSDHLLNLISGSDSGSFTNTGCAETDLEDFEEFGETGEEEPLEDDEVVEAQL